MAESENKLPVKVDLSAKASASLKIKAEVPKAAMGRLVNALTDIISPWSEVRGLRGDQIRIQRADVAIEIAQKAKQMLALQDIEPRPLSTKLLVPFLEKASLEDVDVPLRDAWAALLVSATKTEQARHLTFVDILSRISSQELKLLEEVCFAYKAFPERSYPDGHVERNFTTVLANVHLLQLRDKHKNSIVSVKDEFVKETPLVYGQFMHVSVKRDNGFSYWYFEGGAPDAPGFQSIEMLQHERLIEIVRVVTSRQAPEVGYFNVTTLGLDFVRNCSPQADAMAARRPSPIQPQPTSKEVSAAVATALKKTRAQRRPKKP